MSAFMRGNLRMALDGVRSSKWRSLLTMLGVIVGIVAVVTSVGIGEGIKQQVSAQLNHFGKDLITVRPGTIEPNSMGRVLGSSDVLFGMGAVGGFSARDVAVVQDTAEVSKVVPLGVVPGVAQTDETTLLGGVVVATSQFFPDVLNQNVAYGGFWDDSDEESRFAVLGRQAAESLFNEQRPLGKSFSFRGELFMVRGVLEPFKSQPLSPTAEFDNAVFIPYQTASAITNGDSHLYAMLAKPHDPGALGQTVDAITDRLREAHGGVRDFSVLRPDQNLAVSSTLLNMLTTWIIAVAVIALIIGGVGIMNIMLVSVTERMHEIGVRKAVGATNRQILGQFMLEAVVLSTVGGLIGVLVSLATNFLLNTYTSIKAVISWEAVLIATTVSVLVGVVFGVLPAIKAARKDPIQALRHE